MAKKEKRGKALREKMGQLLELPLDMRKDFSRVTLLGNEYVFIENYGGMIEYETNCIRLVKGICILGTNILVEEMTDDELVITGKIQGISFEN